VGLMTRLAPRQKDLSPRSHWIDRRGNWLVTSYGCHRLWRRPKRDVRGRVERPAVAAEVPTANEDGQHGAGPEPPGRGLATLLGIARFADDRAMQSLDVGLEIGRRYVRRHGIVCTLRPRDATPRAAGIGYSCFSESRYSTSASASGLAMITLPEGAAY